MSDKCAISLNTETIANVKQQIDSNLDDSRLPANETSYSARSRINRDNERTLMEQIEQRAYTLKK